MLTAWQSLGTKASWRCSRSKITSWWRILAAAGSGHPVSHRRVGVRAMRVAFTAENSTAVFIVEDAHTPQPRVKLVCVLEWSERQAHAVGEVEGERVELQQRRAIDAVAVIVGVIAWGVVQAAAAPWAVIAPVIDNCLIRCRWQVHERGARVDDGAAKGVLAVSHPARNERGLGHESCRSRESRQDVKRWQGACCCQSRGRRG